MVEARSRPLIGVTGPQTHAWGPRLCVQVGVWLAGGRTLQMRPRDTAPAAGLDGIVVTGGHDVEPVLYKEEREVAGNYDPERDAFEQRVIARALDERLPLLGICRGAQLLNVYLGGSLIQDLKDHRSKTSNRSTLLPLKRLLVDPESNLFQTLRCETLRINSLHRQSIKELGGGLRIVGRDRDHIVQAVEAPDHDFVVGTQWHPEFLLYLAPHRRLFEALVAAARNRQGTG